MAKPIQGGLFWKANKRISVCHPEFFSPFGPLNFPKDGTWGFPAFSDLSPGDSVKIGTVLLKNESGPLLFSPVSGTVLENTEQALLLQNDFADTLLQEPTALQQPLTELGSKELFDLLLSKGISEVGGFSLSDFKTLPKKLIIHALSSDPFNRTSSAFISKYAYEIISGIKILLKAFQLQSAVFCMNRSDRSVLSMLTKQDYPKELLKIHLIKEKYPVENPQLCYYSLSGKYLSAKKTLKDASVALCTLKTCVDVYNALGKGLPPSSVTLTVSGNALEQEKVLEIPYGCRIADLLQFCFLKKDCNYRILMGSPLTGYRFCDAEEVVSPDATLVLALLSESFEEKNQSGSCSLCGKCAEVCPVGLLPFALCKSALDNNRKTFRKYHAECCLSCGACTAVCPENIDVLGIISGFDESYIMKKPETREKEGQIQDSPSENVENKANEQSEEEDESNEIQPI